MISDNMRKFLSDWLEWSKDPDNYQGGHDFNKDYGLCTNVYKWSLTEFPGDDNIPQCEKVEKILSHMLNDVPYPFGGYYRYCRESREKTMHLNKYRVEWVKNQIEKLK